MRIVAILATYNEERFISICLESLRRQGVDIYLIDNESEDRTVTLAERYLGRGLIDIETLPRRGIYSWRPILERKEQLAATLEADWIMHVDADEIHLPPRSGSTIARSLAEVEKQGYNAVNFMEFTFVPTLEAPDHDHPQFQKTMCWYYPFLQAFPSRLNAWKRQPDPVELAWSGGHVVRFPGLRMYPEPFPMRHYLFLSVPHAIRKYIRRSYDPAEVSAGWHHNRVNLSAEAITLQSQSELRFSLSDHQLDPSHPYKEHPLFRQHPGRTPSRS